MSKNMLGFLFNHSINKSTGLHTHAASNTSRAEMKSFASPETPQKYSSGKQKSRRTMFEHVSSRLSSRNGEMPLSIT
jgi:hypothetical protein